MSNVNTNEWYVFEGGTVDKKTCNKIKRLAKDKWQPSWVDTKKYTTDELSHFLLAHLLILLQVFLSTVSLPKTYHSFVLAIDIILS